MARWGHRYRDAETGTVLDTWFPRENEKLPRSCFAQKSSIVESDYIQLEEGDLTAPPATIPAGLPGAGTQLNIGGTLRYLGTATADQNGAFKVATGGVPANFRDKLLFQGVNLSNSKTTNFFRVIM